MPPLVRRAAPADLPALVERWRELMAAHAALHPALYALAPHAAETYAATLRRQLSERDTLVLAAEDAAGGIAGFLSGGIGLRSPIYAEREVGMIFDLAVRPDRRRQGVGQALLAEAEVWFRRRGVEWIQVDFAPGNALSRGFWTARGFEVLLSEGYRRVGA